jgi:NADH-quinone oxidoreductase subunit G
MIALELASLLGERGFGEDHPLADVTTVAEVTTAMAATVEGWADVSPVSASALEGVVTTYPESSLDVEVVGAPDPISYDFRLVASRTLYDRAVGTQMSRSLAHLAPGAAAHVHPLDLDRMGVADGDDVNLIGPSASTVMPIKADDRVPRGVVWSPYNQKGGKIAEVIDLAADVIDLRIERI